MTTAQHLQLAALARETAHDALLAAHLAQEHGAAASAVAAHADQAALWTAAAEHHERTAEVRRRTILEEFPAPPAIAGLTDGPVHAAPANTPGDDAINA